MFLPFRHHLCAVLESFVAHSWYHFPSMFEAWLYGFSKCFVIAVTPEGAKHQGRKELLLNEERAADAAQQN